MSCHQTSTWADDYSVQQENELEALASIFGEDFNDLSNNHPWKIKRPLEVYLCLRPNGLSNGKESYVTVDLQVQCPPTYPDVSIRVDPTLEQEDWQVLHQWIRGRLTIVKSRSTVRRVS